MEVQCWNKRAYETHLARSVRSGDDNEDDFGSAAAATAAMEGSGMSWQGGGGTGGRGGTGGVSPALLETLVSVCHDALSMCVSLHYAICALACCAPRAYLPYPAPFFPPSRWMTSLSSRWPWRGWCGRAT